MTDIDKQIFEILDIFDDNQNTRQATIAIKALLSTAVREAVDSYTNKLHEWGYIDTDFYTEQPSPQERFAQLKEGDTK